MKVALLLFLFSSSLISQSAPPQKVRELLPKRVCASELIEVEKPFEVNSPTGTIFVDDAEPGQELEGATIDFVNVAGTPRIVSADTDKHGVFKTSLTSGRYLFRVSHFSGGFKCVEGTLIVSRKSKNLDLKLVLPVGT